MTRFSELLLVAAAAALVTTAAPAGAEVRIGLAAPLTGPNAWAGAGTEQGVEVAVADLNAEGGVLGQQMEIITADDYCEATQAVAAANKLVAAQAVAVLGHNVRVPRSPRRRSMPMPES